MNNKMGTLHLIQISEDEFLSAKGVGVIRKHGRYYYALITTKEKCKPGDNFLHGSKIRVFDEYCEKLQNKNNTYLKVQVLPEEMPENIFIALANDELKDGGLVECGTDRIKIHGKAIVSIPETNKTARMEDEGDEHSIPDSDFTLDIPGLIRKPIEPLTDDEMDAMVSQAYPDVAMSMGESIYIDGKKEGYRQGLIDMQNKLTQ